MLFVPFLTSFFAAIAGTDRHRPTNGSAGHHRMHRNHSNHMHHHNRTGLHNRNRTALHERRHRNITTGVRLSTLLHGGNETNLGVFAQRRHHQNKTAVILPSISNTTTMAILYVFTVVEAVCENGLPSYMKVSLEQAIFANPDCVVYLASNFGACNTTLLVANSVPGLQKIDTTAIESRRTQTFRNNSMNMFMSDHYAELWTTSGWFDDSFRSLSNHTTIPNIILSNNPTILTDVTYLLLFDRRNRWCCDWTTPYPPHPALRFFLMEDVMARHGIHEGKERTIRRTLLATHSVIVVLTLSLTHTHFSHLSSIFVFSVFHVEGDNLLYGSLSTIVPTLRKSYRGLAATPLNSPLVFITASVFWISSIQSIVGLNNFFLELSTLKRLWREYLLWLQAHGAGRQGTWTNSCSTLNGFNLDILSSKPTLNQP